MNFINTVFCVFCLFFISSCGEQENQKAKVIFKEIPSALIIDKTEYLNIDADKELETIVTTSDSTGEQTIEFWYKNSKLIKKVKYPWFSINYKWFVELDGDDTKELIRAQGFEDEINYVVNDITSKGEILLLKFLPILIDSRYPKEQFFGYPMDLVKPIQNSKNELLISFDQLIEEESESEKHLYPYIFFKGIASQPEFRYKKKLNNSKYIFISNATLEFEKSKKNIRQHILNKLKLFEYNFSPSKNFLNAKIIILKNNDEHDEFEKNHFGLNVQLYSKNDLWKENNHLIFKNVFNCPSEGFETIAIKNNYFTIQQQICIENVSIQSFITFKVLENEIYLHKYGEEYFDNLDHDKKIPIMIWTEEDFGIVKFEEVTTNMIMSLEGRNLKD